MAREVAYRGQRFSIEFAVESNGSSAASMFSNELGKPDKAKLMALFKIAGDIGRFHNPEKFGDLGNGMFEFKSFQIRMPFAYARQQRAVIVVTHGFIKKRATAPKEEIARAWRIFEEEQARTKLEIVKRAKR